MNLLDEMQAQLEAQGIAHDVDREFGDDIAVLVVNSEVKGNRSMSVGFVFSLSSGELQDMNFLESLEDDGEFNVARKEVEVDQD